VVDVTATVTSSPSPERRIRTGARVAVVVAAVAAVVLGASVWLAGAALVGVVAAGALAGSTRKLTRDDNRERALGSIGLVGGSGTICVAVALATRGSFPGGYVVAGVTVATVLVALDAVIEDPLDATGAVSAAVGRSGVMLGLGIVLAAVVYSGAPMTVAVGAVEVVTVAVGASAFLSLFALQLLAVGGLLLVGVALPILDDWLPDRTDRTHGADEKSEPLEPLRRLGFEPTEIPRPVWVALAVQPVLLMLDPKAVWFRAVLDSLSVLGTAVSALLRYGVFHAPLGLVWLLAGAVLVVRGLQVAFVAWAGRNPPRTLAYSAGGITAFVLGVVLSAVVWVSTFVADRFGYAAVDTYGIGGVALSFVLVALIGFGGLFYVLGPATLAGYVPTPAGYAAGASLLFCSSVLAAFVDATPIAVFVGMAAALLVWDLGENVTGLRQQLGRRVRTHEAEATHATASVLVGIVVVAALAVALYVLGPTAFAPAESSRAMVSVFLSVVALLAFTILVEFEW
jgi:hypothetical protein